MAKQTINRVKLGAFILSGMIFFIAALYIIGSKNNLFGGSVTIHAYFHNVNGLMKGNNVRYNGINVGTVSSISIVEDTIVQVEMEIKDEMTQFIQKNAVASIGTEGLMGNKIVNISPGKTRADLITEGTILHSIRPIEMDEAIRTLNSTNNNIEIISEDLRKVIENLTSESSIFTMFSDSSMNINIREGISNFRETGNRLNAFVGELNVMITELNSSNGTLGRLIKDTTLANDVEGTISNFHSVGKSSATAADDLNKIVSGIKNGEGSLGNLVADTTFSSNLNEAVININESAKNFNETMKALRSVPILRRYFKKQDKENAPADIEDKKAEN